MGENGGDVRMNEPEPEGTRGAAWTRLEIEATVAAYEDMLRKELRGVRYTKSDVVRDLMKLMPARTRGAVELKLQNVSAVRAELGLPWIDGYKPMAHYQSALRDVVVSRADPRNRINEAVAEFGKTPVVSAQKVPRSTSDVLVPPPSANRTTRGGRTSVSITGTAHDAIRDLRRHELGTAGEEWVTDLEREQLSRAGRPDLADLVRWVARDDGDGAGYDILSFSEAGAQRLIEVKTTNYGPLTPFYITRWEVEVSQIHRDSYSLYRVHGFARDPRIYILDGAMDEAARLEPSVFLGMPQ
jgi:hypothetical protein